MSANLFWDESAHFVSFLLKSAKRIVHHRSAWKRKANITQALQRPTFAPLSSGEARTNLNGRLRRAQQQQPLFWAARRSDIFLCNAGDHHET
jgi:hypothetical protein